MNPAYLLFTLLSRAFNGNDEPCLNTTDVMDALVLKNPDYNKYKIPKSGVQINIQVWVQEVSSISELTNDFEIDLYLNEVWNDPNLAYGHMNPCKKENITIDRIFYEKLWTPNTVFINSKYASIHKSPNENIFLMIYPNGTVWANYRLKLTGPCEMDLKDFPMDSQKCFLTFESFNYNTEEVKMRWMEEEPLIIFKPIELPDFTMTNFSADRMEVLYPAGWWDELTIEFRFKRRSGYYLLQGYIPTYLTIFISWISFYLGSKTMPARTMLGVNALLAITFQFGNLMRNLPRVSYVKAIDIWMLACMTFIFASLVELAIIGFLTRNDEGGPKSAITRRRRGEREPLPPTVPEPPWVPVSVSLDSNREFARRNGSMPGVRYMAVDTGSASTAVHCSDTFESHYRTTCCSWNAEKIDNFSMVMFPLTFFLFNVLYWGWYLS